MRTFFICGTPRSGTAWLANFLTTDKSYCYHELLADCCTNIADMKKYFVDSGRNIVGNSDNGNIIAITKILKEFPDAKIVIIKRERQEATKSFLQWHSEIGLNKDDKAISDVFDTVYDNIETLQKHSDYLSINYNDISRVDVCKKIFEYCTGLPFDLKRFELLIKFNIQTDKIHQLKKINRLVETGEINNLIN